MDMHGIAARTKDPATKAAIMGKIDDTDEIIRELRAAIFTLHPAGSTPPAAMPSTRPEI
jgi:signal transduction histidine kinase